MKHSILFGVITATALAAAGCGGPTLDASSDAALEKSSADVRNSLEPAKQEQFDRAMQSLVLSKVMFAPGDEATMRKTMRELFDGKTADEVIAAGEKVAAENKAEMDKWLR